MNTTFKMGLNSFLKIIFTMLIALLVGAIFILIIGENPIDAYAALFRGAFKGKLKLGTTLAAFTPILLTSTAFIVAAKAGAFNVGVEGEVFLGGIVAAYVGINFTFLPKPLLLIACFVFAALVGAVWAYIPAALKAYYGVSEICTTILMNSIAFYLTNYLVSGPMSAGVANAQSLPVSVTLPKIMLPSSLNTGIFIAFIILIFFIWLIYKSTLGFKIREVGMNPENAEYVVVITKMIFINAMLLSGNIGGIAVAIDVLGVHGYFLNNFANGLGSNGMLAALIVKNNMLFAPFMSLFIAVLRTGAMGMQQATSVPKSLVDTITAVFIIFACMDFVLKFRSRKKEVK